MHWTDWLLIVVGGGIMLLVLAGLAYGLDWLAGMLRAVMTR